MIQAIDTKTIVTVRTEVWNTRKGFRSKAVVRDAKGRFNGETNKTRAIDWFDILWG